MAVKSLYEQSKDPAMEAQYAAHALVSQAENEAGRTARALFGDKPKGYTKVSVSRTLDVARRRWADPMFRQQLLQHIGDDKFLAIGEKLGYYTPPQKGGS